jgi:hypothetical protein
VKDKDLTARYAAYFPPSKKSVNSSTTEDKDRSCTSSSSVAPPQALGTLLDPTEAVCGTSPESSIATTQQHPTMLDDTRFNTDRMDFDSTTGLEIQEFDFSFLDVSGTDDCYSYLPITDGGVPS